MAAAVKRSAANASAGKKARTATPSNKPHAVANAQRYSKLLYALSHGHFEWPDGGIAVGYSHCTRRVRSAAFTAA
jgi:hypothetical protein